MITAKTTTTEKEEEKVGGSLRNGPDSGDRHRPSQRRPSLGRDRGGRKISEKEGKKPDVNYDHSMEGAHSLVFFSPFFPAAGPLIARAKNVVYDSK